jgi:hypothetical protein
MGLAAYAAYRFNGVVVDRTADIGYSGDQFIAQATALNENGDHDVRDAVVVEAEAHGASARLLTRGMSKYGQRDFVIEEFPAEHVELGRRLLYDNLAQYSAMQATIEPGQNLAYKRADPAARLIFSDDGQGGLLVSDCHPTEKRAVSGLSKFLSVALPDYLNERRQEAAGNGVASLDDYVELMALLQAGRMDDALRRFGLTYETIGAVTQTWSARLQDPAVALEFSQKLQAHAARQ